MFLPLLTQVSQNPSPPHVRSLEDVTTELSTLSGRRVTVASGLKRNFILLDRRGASAETALRAVARSLSASLLRDADGYRIERTIEDERRMSDERSAKRLAWLEDKMKAVEDFEAARLSKTNPESSLLTEIERTGQGLQSFFHGSSFGIGGQTALDVLPSASLLRSLVRRIGFKALSELPDGMQVYEDAPVFAAKPLPKTSDLLEAYVASLRALNIDRVREAYRKAFGEFLNDDPFAHSPTTAKDMAKLRLAVSSNVNGMVFTLEGFDREGNRDLSASLSVAARQEQIHPSTLMRDPRYIADPLKVELSAEARAMAQFASASPSAERPPWFLRPDKEEPLDGFVREALVGLIAGDGRRCIAINVSDPLWSNVLACVKDGWVNLDVLQVVLGQWSPYVRVQDASSTVWRPIDCKAAESRLADRKALAAFAGSAEKKGYPEVRALARLYHDASPSIGSLANDWHAMAKANARIETGQDGMYPRLYRLLGAIPDPKWAQLQKGPPLTAGALGIVGDLQGFLDDDAGLPVAAEGPLRDLDRHPLEGFEGAALADVPFRVETQRSPVVRVWREPEREGALWMPEGAWTNGLIVSGFVYRQGQFVNVLSRDDFERSLDTLRFRPGAREDTRVVLGLTRGRYLAAFWQGATAPADKALLYADFPQVFRDAAWQRACEAGLRQAKRMRDGAGDSGSGRVQGGSGGSPRP